MSDESFLGGIGAYLFGPKATKYTRPEPEPFPAREDVIAARDYKERFGNPNEVMIKGERWIEPPHGNVRYRQEGTPLRQVSKGQAADAWNEYRLPENRDKEILSKVKKTPLDEAAADALYAEQIAANRSSIGMMAFDPDRIAISPSNRGRTTIGLGGMYRGGREDMAWQDQDDPGAMVHEMFHRGLKPLMAKDRNKYDEETMVRALIQRHHGDIEEKGFRPENRDEKTQPGWAQIQRAKRAINDPEFVKELDKYERMAGEVVAARNLERHPIGLGYATGGQVSNTKAIAKHLATMGRYGDDHLLHVNSAELRGLAAAMPGGKLTINPQTGQPEAFLPFLLPLLGGLAGSAFLPGAVAAMGLGTLGTTMAGAIGSGAVAAGLGLAEGNDIGTAAGKGLLSGLGSYGLGSAMEGLASGTGATATEAAEAAAKEAAKESATAGIGTALPGRTFLDPSVMPSTSSIDRFNPLDQGQYLPASSAQPWAGAASVGAPLQVPAPGMFGDMGNQLSNAGSNYLDTAQKAAGNLANPKALWGTFGTNAGRTLLPMGLSIAGQGMFDQKPPPQMPVEETYGPASTAGTGRQYAEAPSSYRPGRDPEWNYFRGGYQNGGRVAPRAYRDDSGEFTYEGQPVKEGAAYEGPDAFGQRWREDDMLVPSGESAPRQMTPRMTYRGGPQPTDYRIGRDLLGGGRDGDLPFRARWGLAQGGPISGPGGGLDDSIPAIIDGRVPASLSSGEHVIPAAVVSALGNGSTEEGSRQLEAMTDRILKKKFGTKNRTPRPLNPSKMMPV